MSSKKLELDFSSLKKTAVVPSAQTNDGVGEERQRKKRPGRKPKPDKEDTYTVEVPKKMQNALKAAAALSGKKIYEYVEQALQAAIDKTMKSL